jgi:hypothetical protein
VSLSRSLLGEQLSGSDLTYEDGGVPEAVLLDWYSDVVSTEDSCFELDVSLLSECADADSCCFEVPSSGYAFVDGVCDLLGVSLEGYDSLCAQYHSEPCRTLPGALFLLRAGSVARVLVRPGSYTLFSHGIRVVDRCCVV